MAVPTARFTVDEGEIIDTRTGQIITPDAFNRLSSDTDKQLIEEELRDAGVLAEEPSGSAQPPTTPSAVTSQGPQHQWIARAKALNPDYSEQDLEREYRKKHTPKPDNLPNLEEWLPRAKSSNPGYTTRELRDEWEIRYGQFGAKEKPAPSPGVLGTAADIGLKTAKGVIDVAQSAAVLPHSHPAERPERFFNNSDGSRKKLKTSSTKRQAKRNRKRTRPLLEQRDLRILCSPTRSTREQLLEERQNRRQGW